MSYPLGQSFKIEDIIASRHGKYLTIQKMWWNNFAKLNINSTVGGQSVDPTFVTISKCDPLIYDGISSKYKVPYFPNPPF